VIFLITPSKSHRDSICIRPLCY